MSKIRVLAIEDDPIHQDKLRMVMDVLGFDLIDVVEDPAQLLGIINATKPDVMLMDIDLGNDVSGIDLVEKVNEVHDIPIVFLTSFIDDQTFHEAKKTLPAAYLTKPYKAEDLNRAVELAVLTSQNKLFGSANRKNQLRVKANLFSKNGNILTKVAISDIKFIEAYDKYCYINIPGQKYMLKERLKNILLQLPESQFCQIHRSYIINISAIESIDLQHAKLIIMGKAIGMGKKYRQNLFANVSLLG